MLLVLISQIEHVDHGIPTALVEIWHLSLKYRS